MNTRTKKIQKLVVVLLCCTSAFLLFSSDESSSRKLLDRSTNENLLIVGAVTKTVDLNIVAHNRHHIFTDDEWDCVVFTVATDQDIPKDNEVLSKLKNELNCSITRMPTAIFGDFLQYVNPTFVNNYEYVSLLSDSIFFPIEGEMALKPSKVIGKMKELDIGSMQPMIKSGTHHVSNFIEQSDRVGCITQFPYIETSAQFFSREAWLCYYQMLHYSGTNGWCYDLCMPKKCPDVVEAVDSRFIGFHLTNEKSASDMLKSSYVTSGKVKIKEDTSSWDFSEESFSHSPKDEDEEADPFRICKKYDCAYVQNWHTEVGDLWCPKDKSPLRVSKEDVATKRTLGTQTFSYPWEN